MIGVGAHGPEACPRALLARKGRTFWWASRLLGRADADAVAELYRFCRLADDLADDVAAAAGARERLDRVALALATCDTADPLAGPVLALGIARQLPIGPLQRLVQALAADTGPRRIATVDELLAYADGVAGTVGEVMAALLGARDPEACRPAVDLGVAMQLTNIVRDVREDASIGRIYLPAAWLPDADLPFALEGTARIDAARALWPTILRVLDLADRHYNSAAAGYRSLPWRARLTVVAAAAAYREIGATIRRAGPDAFGHERVVVTTTRKTWVLLRSLSAVVMPTAAAARVATGQHGYAGRAR